MLAFYLCLCLASGLFSLGFPTKTLYAFLLSLICATCPTYIVLSLITQIIISEKHYDETPDYAVFSILLLRLNFHHSYLEIMFLEVGVNDRNFMQKLCDP